MILYVVNRREEEFKFLNFIVLSVLLSYNCDNTRQGCSFEMVSSLVYFRTLPRPRGTRLLRLVLPWQPMPVSVACS